jgi:cob(I)alamin adenosyltransferase
MPGKPREKHTGFTDSLGGSNMRKDHPLIDLVGEIDELTAWIGLLRVEVSNEVLDTILQTIQIHLSLLMSMVSSSGSKLPLPSYDFDENLKALVGWIEDYKKSTKFPHTFLQAGSTRKGALLNLVRTITRRVERKAVSALYSDDGDWFTVLQYLNKLSTFFYILWVRSENK